MGTQPPYCSSWLACSVILVREACEWSSACGVSFFSMTMHGACRLCTTSPGRTSRAGSTEYSYSPCVVPVPQLLLQVSACQADVAATLVSLGLPFIEECQVAPGLVVDAAVPSLQLAVEVDGPSHFTRNLVPLNSSESAVGRLSRDRAHGVECFGMIAREGWGVSALLCTLAGARRQSECWNSPRPALPARQPAWWPPPVPCPPAGHPTEPTPTLLASLGALQGKGQWAVGSPWAPHC